MADNLTGLIAKYSYLGPNRVSSRTNGNGTYTLYTYDAARRMTNITHFGSNGVAFESHSFGWDPIYNKTQHSYLRTALPNITRYFTNDSANRLTGSVAPWRTNIYALDGVGNRTNGYEFNSVNEYTNTPFGTNVFDANGNLIQTSYTNGTTVYSYDYRNLVVSAQPSLSSTTFYIYDAFGRRVAKAAGGATTRFFYDGWQELEEQSNGVTLATYVSGNYIDEALTMRRGGTDYYYHADDLCDVTALTDVSGNLVERYDYDDYGQILSSTNGQPIFGIQSALGNPLFFNGRRCDPETGLYFYRTRYLHPTFGRFTSRDEIGVWGDLRSAGNGYTYVANLPTVKTDPLGLFTDEEIIGRHEVPKKESRACRYARRTGKFRVFITLTGIGSTATDISEGLSQERELARKRLYVTFDIPYTGSYLLETYQMPKMPEDGAWNWAAAKKCDLNPADTCVEVMAISGHASEIAGAELVDGKRVRQNLQTLRKTKFCTPCTLFLAGCYTEGMAPEAAQITGCTTYGTKVTASAGVWSIGQEIWAKPVEPKKE
jgi:RHS repeat-associated protein